MKQKATKHSKKKYPKLNKKNTSIDKINEILNLLNLKDNNNEKLEEKPNDNNLIQNSNNNNKDVNKNKRQNIYNTENNTTHYLEIKNAQKAGLADKNFLIEKISHSAQLNISDFYLQDVAGDGNCGYRCISLQLFGNENHYAKVRESVYNYLNLNREQFDNFNFEYEGNILSSSDYIDKINNDKEWMGELEINAISIIYNVNIIVFQITYNDELQIINKYGNFDDITNHLLLTLCYVGENHFKVLYEKSNLIDNLYNNILLNEKDIQLHDINTNIELKFKYANDKNKIYSYEDIKNFVVSKKNRGELKYPDFINNIINKKERHNKKQNFKKACKGYDFDNKINRLTKTIKIKKSKTIYINNTYIIPYEFEKLKTVNKNIFSHYKKFSFL